MSSTHLDETKVSTSGDEVMSVSGDEVMSVSGDEVMSVSGDEVGVCAGEFSKEYDTRDKISRLDLYST